MTQGLIERIRHAETVAAQRINDAEAGAEETRRTLAETHRKTLLDLENEFRTQHEQLSDLARQRADLVLEKRQRLHEQQIRTLERLGRDHGDAVVRLMIQTLLE
jgi:hypothetical protein